MKINEIRTQIDTIDDQIVDLFSKRLQLCKIIGDLKKQIIYQFLMSCGNRKF